MMSKRKVFSVIISTFMLLISIGCLIGVGVACGFYDQIVQTGFKPDTILGICLFLSMAGLMISIGVILAVVIQGE